MVMVSLSIIIQMNDCIVTYHIQVAAQISAIGQQLLSIMFC